MLYIKTSLPFPTLTQRINNRANDPDFPLSGLQYIGATDNRAAWTVGNCAILATGDDAGATLRLRVTMPYGEDNKLWGIDDAARYVWGEILSNLGEVTTDLQKHLSMLIPKKKPTPTDPATVAAEWLQIPEKRGPTVKTRERAKVFRELKEKHPEWSYDTVAMQAMELHTWLGEISGQAVRNAYKAMAKVETGWKFEKSDRVR